ncbi:MAG: SsrA-binding protein [Clostridiales bacterium 38-18]|jgi:SsrA-binding protein|nr:MAG: SsrA-binding protein [Clostridiales bacterium 38-18]
MAELKLIAQNKKAWHDYFIEETYEAGIELFGTEVKSIRNGKASIKESYAEIKNGEVFILGMNVTPYDFGNRYNQDPIRVRKLLLHRREIAKLLGYTTREGYTLVPLKVYINQRGLIKVEIAVAKGKKLYDKRDTLAKKDADRKIQKAIKDYNR